MGWLKRRTRRIFAVVVAAVVVAAAVVITAFTFGAAAGLIVAAVAVAAAIIAWGFASAMNPDDQAGAPIGPAATCYYQGQAFSEGAVLTMEDVRYVCGADGKWAPVQATEIR
jgi:hypothetical protein